MKTNLQDTTKKETLKKPGNEALRWIADALTWSQISFFLLGETGEKVLLDEELLVDKVQIGILKKDFGETTKRLFKGFVPDVKIGDTINLEKDGVPIEIKIIHKHYRFFENPDTVMYTADEYKIPNPWHKYWNVRNLIK